MHAVSQLQTKLDELYSSRLSNYIGELELSYPLLPEVTQRYIDNRVVILGQETNTWYRQGPDDLRNYYNAGQHTLEHEGLCDTRYNHFMRHIFQNGYGGKFWAFNSALYGAGGILPGPMINERFELGHLWLNLFSVEAMSIKNGKSGLPTKNARLRKVVVDLQGDLLRQTIQILKPRLIISCTGPSLDAALSKSLGNADLNFNSISHAAAPRFLENDHYGFSAQQLGCTNIDITLDGPISLLRSYHPSYFMGRINRERWKYEFAKGQNSMAESYMTVLMDAIRTTHR